MSQADMAMIGLGVMGRNLALNMANHGYAVAGFDLDSGKISTLLDEAKGKAVIGAQSIEELAAALKTPRRYMLMVPAGRPVDAVIEQIVPYLEEGDIIIDGGNSHFEDTNRRTAYLEGKGFNFIGTGVSGGEEGALKGPSLMPGGSQAAWPHVREIFQTISAKTADGTPCCDWVGPGGAGHFVKMVHNGIEYGDMQLICEAYFLLKQVLGLSSEKLQRVFEEWNRGDLNSYLVEITSKILKAKDDETGQPLVDVILDTAGQKGTGKWTSMVALDQGIAAPTIAEAVFARCLSAIKEERVEAASILDGITEDDERPDAEALTRDIHQALYASKICSYAQGFALLKAASDEYGWDLNLGNISMLWREGCIIRAAFLARIKEAYDRRPDLLNLLLDPYFKEALTRNQPGWRRTIARAALRGVPVPAFSSALSYFDGYRAERLPANLLQAQRDYFGAHTYERVDKPRGEFFHTNWTGRGGDTAASTYSA